jgi:hypothetical protein
MITFSDGIAQFEAYSTYNWCYIDLNKESGNKYHVFYHCSHHDYDWQDENVQLAKK